MTTSIFTNFAKTHSEVANIDPVGDIEWTVFVRSPLFLTNEEVEDQSAAGYLDHILDLSIDELKDQIGWQALENGVDNTGTYTVGWSYNTVSPIVSLELDDDLSYKGDPVFATAFAFSVSGGTDDGKVLMILQPEEPFFMWGGDDPNWTQLSNAEPLFNFLETADTGDLSNPEVGAIAISVPVAGWESARAAHVWMDPQRINLVANPSFEATNGDFYAWRSANTVARVSGGVGRTPRQYCGEVSGAGTKVLESLPFPAAFYSEWWSVEAFVQGSGDVRIGVLLWDTDMDPDNVYYQTTEWYSLTCSDPQGSPTAGEFTQISALIPNLGEDMKEGQFRLEFAPASADNKIWVDDVIVEPNAGRLGYFDGDWSLGMPGDYQWYGGGLTPHSFSIFYNNRNNVERQLFGWYEADGTKHEGSTDRLVPEGVRVVPHWDDIYSVKSQSWISDVYVPVVPFSANQQGTVVSVPAGHTNTPSGSE